MAETREMPAPSHRSTVETSRASAFGDWDLRRESSVRRAEPVPSSRVERFTDIKEEDDELETPPFFRNR